MTEEPNSLKIVQRIYEEAEIEREFILTLDKLYFTVTNPVDVIFEEKYTTQFIVADYLFDSMFLEKELTAYLMASDPELAEWNRKHHLSYLEDEMNYFVVYEEMFSADDSTMFSWLKKAKSSDDIEKYYTDCHEIEYYKEDGDTLGYETNCGNQFAIESIREIPKSHFDVLAKYLTIV